jgi:thioesterase domain-containing protein
MKALCAELQQTWHREIPISAAMGISVVEGDAGTILVHAPLAPNINLHGTAFAGSLYAVAALTGWGMTWLALKTRDLDGSIVLAEGHIEYAKAVSETIVCRCDFDALAQERQLERLRAARKTVFTLHVTIGTGNEVACRFEGRYAVRVS